MRMYFYETDIGKIYIAENNKKITNLYFKTDAIPQNVEICETATIREAYGQLAGYLAGEVTEFDLPLSPKGTDFMQSVWRSLCKIPFGTTASYGDIAKHIGRPKAARAVGLANNRNPIPIFIPCHRVVGADGKLVGYRGGIALKEKLLQLEKGKCDGNL